LSALKVLSGKEKDPELRLLLDHITKRMDLILGDLESKANIHTENKQPVALPLHLILRLVALEKTKEFQDKFKIEFHNVDGGSFWIIGHLSELLRTLSNLINNSNEASIPNSKMTLSIRHWKKGWTELVLKDFGRGIPTEILDKVTQEGFSFGKSGGTGHGLFQAKITVEQMQGHLHIQSQDGEGTTISLRFPTIEPPNWSVDKISINGIKNILLVDDDPSCQPLWREKFHQQSVHFFYYKHPKEVPVALIHNPQTLLLMDNTFGTDYGLGLRFVERMRGAKSILVTSDWQLKEIQETVEQLRIPLCGKEFIEHLAVVS
jgi:hypothetical protein